jgi:hypothetical protein
MGMRGAIKARIGVGVAQNLPSITSVGVGVGVGIGGRRRINGVRIGASRGGAGRGFGAWVGIGVRIDAQWGRRWVGIDVRWGRRRVRIGASRRGAQWGVLWRWWAGRPASPQTVEITRWSGRRFWTAPTPIRAVKGMRGATKARDGDARCHQGAQRGCEVSPRRAAGMRGCHQGSYRSRGCPESPPKLVHSPRHLWRCRPARPPTHRNPALRDAPPRSFRTRLRPHRASIPTPIRRSPPLPTPLRDAPPRPFRTRLRPHGASIRTPIPTNAPKPRTARGAAMRRSHLDA